MKEYGRHRETLLKQNLRNKVWMYETDKRGFRKYCLASTEGCYKIISL
jgi:hypothetical protein